MVISKDATAQEGSSNRRGLRTIHGAKTRRDQAWSVLQQGTVDPIHFRLPGDNALAAFRLFPSYLWAFSSSSVFLIPGIIWARTLAGRLGKQPDSVMSVIHKARLLIFRG